MIYWDYDRITLGSRLQKGGTEPEWEFRQDAFGDFCLGVPKWGVRKSHL